jgi:preprotein translocase subunit SecY
MLKVFSNAWKVKDIRRKILFIIFILAIFRLGSFIPLPGIDIQLIQEAKRTGTSSVLSTLVGGKFATIFELGIGPYITASIIMQLLTVALPFLERIQKEGEEGRKKINQYTRNLAVILAILQAGGNVLFQYRDLFVYNNTLVYITAVVASVTGTIFIMWLAELLTERGIGNGSSFIIFANILSSLPSAAIGLYQTGAKDGIRGWLIVAVLIVIFILLMGFVILIQEGERRIPVQYSKKMVGKGMQGGQSSFIPIKVNIAGVMSIIFALSLISFPSVILGFLGEGAKGGKLDAIANQLQLHMPIGAILYVILIFFFTFFYTSFAINTIEMAENMKKSGGFVPGIRPGKPTSDFIQKTVDRLSWIGGSSYALLAVIPILFQMITKINVGFGGTTLLIVTGVALEIVKQLEAQLLMRHYKGFLS